MCNLYTQALVRPQAREVFDLADAHATDALLAARERGGQGSLL